jgi:hemerythrin-like domain-containing protein
MKVITKWGIQNTQGTTIEEIKSQIQEDLMTYLDSIDEHVGSENEEIVTTVCQIIVDNFNTLKK